MPQIKVNGTGIYYRAEGQGPVVVLSHSSCASGGQWRKLMDQGKDRYHMIAIDQYGHGKSERLANRAPESYAPWVDAIEAICRESNAPVHLVGHSAGGAMTTFAALRLKERVASVTLIEPVLFFLLRDLGERAAWDEIRAVKEQHVRKTESGNLDSAASGFIEYWLGAGAWSALPEEQRSAIQAAAPEVLPEWSASFNTAASSDDIAALDTPTLLIQGTQTTLAAARVIALLRRILPNQSVVEIPGAGHMSPITHPEQVNAAILAHLDRNSDRRL